MGGKRWTKQELDLLIELNKEGKNYIEISNSLKDRTLNACRIQGNKLGLDGENNNANTDFFLRDDEEKHYILGYWLADGCIMKKSGGYYFSIVSKDIGHLEKISKVMGIKTKIYENSNNTHELRVGNKKLVQSLVSIGGIYRKTKKITIYDIKFNKKYFYTILRGLFDGDGGFQYSSYVRADGKRCLSSIVFAGSKLMIKSIYKYLGYGTCYQDSRGGDGYYLGFYGDKMRNLLHKMYYGSTIYLDRKYEIYKQNTTIR